MDQRRLAASRAANRRKLIPLILAALFYQAALAFVLFQATGSPFGAIIGAVLPLFAIPIFYMMHDRVMTRGLAARPVAIPEDPELFAITGRLAQVAGIPAPAIYNISETGINGFATGLRGQARLFLTEGMLDQLSPELDAGLAQQLSHVATEDTRVDQLAFGLTGWILMPLTLLLRAVWGLESWMRTTAARASNAGNGIGTFIAWPIYAIGAVFVIAAGIFLAVLTVPARFADVIVFRKREVNADAIAASMVSPRAMANLLVLASESPAPVPSRVASKSALMDTRPREPWWRDPYVTRASAEHRRKLLGAMPQPDPTTAVMLTPAAAAAPAAAYSPAPANLGTVRSAEGLMLYQKVLYMVAGAVLGVAGTVAAYMFIIDAEEDTSVQATPTVTATPTSTARPTRTPTTTRTPAPTRTPGPATDFVVGQTVTLSNGSGNCLQTYTEPTFQSEKLRCEDDLTQKQLTSGPFQVLNAADDRTYIWWGLEGEGFIIENWIRE